MLISLLESLIIIVPLLVNIAYMTLGERKVMGAMQRRVGPNVVGVYGVLQPFSDGLKLLLKESIFPTRANRALFILAPTISLTLSILSWAVIPFAKGTSLGDLTLGLLFLLAVSSLSVYGVLLAGWSANSKYAFLGSLRSTAQFVSYELPLAMVVLVIIAASGSLSLTVIVESQQGIWYVIPLLPLSLLWIIVILAETNRPPFDLPEAESELVAGFFVEHSALPFAFFFLAEYGSILLISTLTAILFLGGYLIPFLGHGAPFFEALSLGVKASAIFFIFIWVRASYPRVRYDQLMVLCWTHLLPLSFAFFVLVVSLLVAFDITPISPIDSAPDYIAKDLVSALTTIKIVPNTTEKALVRVRSSSSIGFLLQMLFAI
jgi:NADH:ubiquinone oxidoreductase subunit H